MFPVVLAQHLLVRFTILPLAQASPWDEPAAPPPPPKPTAHPMSFSDLQEGMRAYNAGETDNSMRNGLLIMIAAVAVLALLLHLRQRHKSAGPPDSISHLGWELSRQLRFPMGTKLLLWWVARSSRTPIASLMLSSALFDKAVAAWAAQPTFGVARQWGRGRLNLLRPALFAT